MSNFGNVNINELSALIKSKRGKNGLRAAAAEAGVSPSTLSRVEQSKIPDLQTLMKLCDWLNISVNEFIHEDERQENISTLNPKGLDTPSIIAAHLRADKELSLETAEALAEMVRIAYVTVTSLKGNNMHAKRV
jgi:transcriptional regulator with XRE-family HTH domain